MRWKLLEQHLFQADLAKLFGVGISSTRNWEQGVHQPTETSMPRIIARPGYGGPRMILWLRAHGHHGGHNRIAYLMHYGQSSSRLRCSFRACLIDSDANLPIAADRSLSRAQPARPDASRVADRADVQTTIFEWPEVFYNRERSHSARSYQTPADVDTNLTTHRPIPAVHQFWPKAMPAMYGPK